MYAAAALICAALAATAAAFEVTAAGVARVGSAAPGRHLWRPHSAIALNASAGHVAVRLSTGPNWCDLLPVDPSAKPACTAAAALTTDGGITFAVTDDATDFCGSAGVVQADSSLLCLAPAGLGAPGPDSKQSFPSAVFSVVTDGAEPVLQRAAGPAVTVNLAKMAKAVAAGDAPLAVRRFGSATLPFPDRGLSLWAAEVGLPNGTAALAVLKTTDHAATWEYVSTVAMEFGDDARMMRMSDTKVLLVAGRHGAMQQAQSLYLATRFAAAAPAPFVNPPGTYQSPGVVTVATGTGPRPKLHVVALTSAKNSQKSFDLVLLHRHAAQAGEDIEPFPDALATAAPLLEVGETGVKVHPDPCYDGEEPLGPAALDALAAPDAAVCATSSNVAIADADGNGTAVVFYDRIVGGFSADHRGHTVYAVRLAVNDTDERAALEAKILQEEVLRKAQKEMEAESVKQRQELRARKQKQQQRHRKDEAARRRAWLEADAVNVAAARELAGEGGDVIVVRQVDPASEDLERELF